MSSHIVTSCKDCKFAQFDGNTQSGCEFSLLEKYKAAGIEVVDAYDDHKEFNVINRICMYSRHKSNVVSKEEVIKQIEAKYQIIIFISDDLVEFDRCLESIMIQRILPQHITVIKPYSLNVQPFQYTKRLAKTKIPWRFQDTVVSELKEGDLVDLALDINAFPYYIVVNSRFTFPASFSDEFNNLINEKFTIFSYIDGGIHQMYIVPTIYHKQLSGNSFKNLLTKILEDDKLSTKYVGNIGELIPCLKFIS